MQISHCGTKYVNGIYRKQINRKTKTHSYVKFIKSQTTNTENDQKENTNTKIKIQVLQDCKTGEFTVETSQNKKLYASTSDGKWSIIDGARPMPSFLPYYVITQFFPCLDQTNNFIKPRQKKSKKNKKRIQKYNDYNASMDTVIDPSFKLCKHYKRDCRIINGFVLFYKDVFSQWFSSNMIIDNVVYANCEQFMMAEKAKLFNDSEYYELILQTTDPRQCKKLGRGVRNFKESKWREHREDIVYRGNVAKYTQNEILQKKLLSYDHSLCFVEASSVDKVWGIGIKITDPSAGYKRNWRGLNLLGKAVTKVRDHLIAQ